MAFKTLITGILALVYCVAAHYFVTAYTQYHIHQQKLGLLRGQERFLRTQTSALSEKKQTLEKVQQFVQTTRKRGLIQDYWDRFIVDLDNEGLSFEKLETILEQTTTSSDYYYIPTFLGIRTGSRKQEQIQPQDVASSGPNQQTSPQDQPGSNNVTFQNSQQTAASALMDQTSTETDNLNESDLSASDVRITIEGHFLVKRRGPNG